MGSRCRAYFFCVLQAVTLPGVGRQPQLILALHLEVLHSRIVFPYRFSGCWLGLPPRRSSFSALLSHSTSFTLLRLLCLPGPPGGFQVATTGKTKTTNGKEFSIDMAVRDINSDIHDVARWRTRLFFFGKTRCGESATHRRSAWGAFWRSLLGLGASRRLLLFSFLLFASLGCRAFGAVCVFSFSALELHFRRHSNWAT